MVKIISDTEFENEVLKSDIPVVADFFATWCGPCKMIAPTLDEISGDYLGKVKVVKVDVDQSNKLAMNLRVRSVPTLLFFKGGKIADTQVGALPKSEIVSKIEKLL